MPPPSAHLKSDVDFFKGHAGFPASVEMNQAEVDSEIHMESRR